MSLSDYLLGLLGVYGPPVLFAVLLIGSVGVPLPATLMLIAVGSFVAQGEMNLWWVILAASAGAILGDNIGYALGRWGGHRAARYVSKWGGISHLERATEWSEHWGGIGVFLSRWLLTPLGPWLNLTSGLTNYPWPRFLILGAAGEVLWVVLYVMLGKFFSDHVQELSELLGNLTWVLVGVVVAVVPGWKLVQYLRTSPAEGTESPGLPVDGRAMEEET